MDQAGLRSQLWTHKSFLLKIYKGDQHARSALVGECSEEELKLLFYILSYVASGQIPLFKKSARKIGQDQLQKLGGFESLQYSPDVRTSISQLSGSLHELLRPLFEHK